MSLFVPLIVIYSWSLVDEDDNISEDRAPARGVLSPPCVLTHLSLMQCIVVLVLLFLSLSKCKGRYTENFWLSGTFKNYWSRTLEIMLIIICQDSTTEFQDITWRYLYWHVSDHYYQWILSLPLWSIIFVTLPADHHW